MTPTLFEFDATRFDGMGIGGLGECESCQVKWQLNGVYELTMVYPVSGRRYADLKCRRIIVAGVGPDEEPQPFRIYRMRPALLSKVIVYARHLAYDLMGCPLPPFPAGNLRSCMSTATYAAQQQGFPFALSADFDSGAQCGIKVPRSVWAMMGGQQGSFLDVYGGEWDFDGLNCTLRQRMGAELDFMVKYGKNLQTLEQDENLANVWTGIQPYWQSADGLTVVTLPEGNISAGTYNYVRILVWDASTEFEEPPTVEQLRERTRQYIHANRVGEPHVSLDVKFISLAQTEEYKHRRFPGEIHKGDTVTVEFPTCVDRKTGAPTAFVRTSARVVEYVWLPILERYDTIRIGAKKANFASVVAQATKDLSWVLSKVGGKR